MDLSSNIAPVTNRGVETPMSPNFKGIDYFSNINDSYLLVDWIQCTIHKNYNIYKLFKELFNLNSSDVIISNKAFFGYNLCYSYKDIKIFLNDYREDMGIHIYITGSGCRDIEDLNILYIDLFKKLISLGAVFTRVDISFDIFTEKYFSVEKIGECIKNNEVVSRFKNSIEFLKTDLSNSSTNGYTIWFGSRASKIQIVFYDKLKERECNNYVIANNIKFWNRLEIRFRDNYATEVIYNFVNNDFYKYIISILNNYISFKEYNSCDLKHKYRWNNKKWWSNFLNNAEKISFSNVNVESSISKKNRWLENSVSRTNFMVFLSDLKIDNITDDVTSFYLYNLLKDGAKKITESDLQYINSYRLKNNLNPIKVEDFNDILRDIKDLLINNLKK